MRTTQVVLLASVGDTMNHTVFPVIGQQGQSWSRKWSNDSRCLEAAAGDGG